MLKPPTDLSGQRFGRLVVRGYSNRRVGSARLWECICDCGTEHHARGYLLKRGETRSCGCLRREDHSAKQDVATRFWEKTRRADSGCLEWTGCMGRGGYGMFSIRRLTAGVTRKMDYAHRIAWTLHHGPIPGGLSVLHQCDNPKCVEPSHLYLGTQARNMLDASLRERFSLAKLNWSTVEAIRSKRAAGMTLKAIADEMGLSEKHVQQVTARRRWRGVTETASEVSKSR